MTIFTNKIPSISVSPVVEEVHGFLLQVSKKEILKLNKTYCSVVLVGFSKNAAADWKIVHWQQQTIISSTVVVSHYYQQQQMQCYYTTTSSFTIIMIYYQLVPQATQGWGLQQIITINSELSTHHKQIHKCHKERETQFLAYLQKLFPVFIVLTGTYRQNSHYLHIQKRLEPCSHLQTSM